VARSHISKNAKKGSVRYIAYGIPLLALAIVGGVYVAYILPTPASPPAMNFVFRLLVKVSNENGTQARYVAPKGAVGEAGGFWATSQFNSYGTDTSHYPIYMDIPSTACTSFCVVNVRSKVVYNYTLGDYFNVWGQLLGQNNTIGITRSGNAYWELCVGVAPASYHPPQWGGLVLQPAMNITLLYHDVATPGCVLS